MDGQRNYPEPGFSEPGYSDAPPYSDGAPGWYSERGYSSRGGEGQGRYGDEGQGRYGDESYPQSDGRYSGGPGEYPGLEPRPRPDIERYDEPRRGEPGRGDLTGGVDPGRPADLPTSRTGPIGPRSGVPLPGADPIAVPGPAPAARRPAPVSGSPGPLGDGVYRSKRPAAAVLFGVVAAILEIPALLLLREATFGDPMSASGVISAACLVLALPAMAVGLYAVATGAVRAAGPNSAQAWLRPPVAYLTVALVLFVAAGLAAA